MALIFVHILFSGQKFADVDILSVYLREKKLYMTHIAMLILNQKVPQLSPFYSI